MLTLKPSHDRGIGVVGGRETKIEESRKARDGTNIEEIKHNIFNKYAEGPKRHLLLLREKLVLNKLRVGNL